VKQLNREHPEDRKRAIHVVPEIEGMVGSLYDSLLIVWAAVGCVLLIACANVANLLLARSSDRQREFSVRIALGAGRIRILRQLLTENVLLAFLSGALGLLLATFGIELIKTVAPQNIPRLSETTLNFPVMIFTAVVSLGTSLIFGLAPAIQTFKASIAESMKEGGRTVTEGAAKSRLRQILVIGEIAVSVVLLIAAALLFRTFSHTKQVNPGFVPQNIVSMRLNLPETYTPEREQNFMSQLLESVKSLPQIHAASAVFSVPMSGRGLYLDVDVEKNRKPEGQRPSAYFNVVEPQYFHVMGISMQSGRDFNSNDRLDTTPVIIVNEALAVKFFGTKNPIGERIQPGVGNGYSSAPWRTIVGIVANVHEAALDQSPVPEVYIPRSQCPAIGSSVFIVKTNMTSTAAVQEVQKLVWRLDKNVPVFNGKTLEGYVSESFVQPRFHSLLFGLFSILSAVLAAIGLYGVISYSVAQRIHEIGIRMVLGADRQQVLRMVLNRGMMLTVAGITAGLLVAYFAAKLLSPFLFGITATDPVTFISIPFVLACIAILACAIPAMRAVNVNPIIALRHE